MVTTLLSFVVGSSVLFGGTPIVEKSCVTCPWLFDAGTPTSRNTAITSLGEACQKNGYSLISTSKAEATYKAMGIPMLSAVDGPKTSQLVQFGKKVGANYVVYGMISWHTRSIWVGAGPKTISTCTIDANVLDVSTGKVTYSKKGIEARSDEKENAVKLAAAVLITPLVTAVSGGPQTPQEQRAVQIAIARTFTNWNKQLGK